MRSRFTLIVVGAVGLVAALALADTLRHGAQSGPPAVSTPSASKPGTTQTGPPTLLDTLRAEAVSGFVVYSDRGCRLHSLLLPRMVDDVIRDESGAEVVRCRFSVENGRIVRGDSDQAAGGLSVKAGQVVDGRRVVVARVDLRRAARRNPLIAGLSKRFPLSVRVTGLGRLGASMVVVGLRAAVPGVRPASDVAALFSGTDIQSIATSFTGPYRDFFASADGALVGAGNGTVFTRTGRSFDPPQSLPAGHAVAFSPDDRWIAWVNGRSFFLVGAQSAGQPARIIRLPVPARDLVWQPITSGTATGPPIRR